MLNKIRNFRQATTAPHGPLITQRTPGREPLIPLILRKQHYPAYERPWIQEIERNVLFKIWLQICNLGVHELPHIGNFLSIYTFFNGVEVIVKFVPLVPLMTQVAETHIDTQKSLQTNLKYYVYLPNVVWKLLRQISVHKRVWKCVSATCVISGTSGTNLTMTSTLQLRNVVADTIYFRYLKYFNYLLGSQLST